MPMLSPSSPASTPAAPAKTCCRCPRTDFLALTTLLLANLLIRNPFMARGVMNGDSENYTFGALTGDFVAHPPGYFAFVMAGALLNRLVGNINTSFTLISLAACLASVAFCYLLARAVGLRWQLAALAAASYSASINLLAFGGLALSHTTEAMFATLFILLAHRAITTQRFSFALAATLVWGISGAFRPSCAILLAPVWLYTIWKAHRPLGLVPWALILLHLALGGALTAGWLQTNKHLLSKASWAQSIPGDKSVSMQAYLPSSYDSSDMSLGTRSGPARPTYHMPGFEFVAWLEENTGIYVIPRVANLAPPSLHHASKLTAVQTAKLAYFLVLSAPILLAIPFLLLFRRRSLLWPDRPTRHLLLVWLIPPTLFYMFGHLGALGYLEIYLSGLFILTTFIAYAGPGALQNAPATAPLWARGTPALLLLPAAGLAFFLLAHPLPHTTNRNKLLNVILFQYDGAAIRQLFGTSRTTVDFPGGFETDPEIRNARTDEELMAAYRKLHFTPVPRFDVPATQPATSAATQPPATQP